jgi:predicted transposase YbfD/YdcC
MAIRPEAFQACFAAWVRSLRDEAAAETGVGRPTLAIDGKTLRRSHDRKSGLGALHSVTVWASEYGLSLGQVACDEKSNEITAISELLKLVDVAGGVVTIDAMGCQKEIAGAIIAAKGDYVLALKDNQPRLHQAVVDHLMSRWEADFAGDQAGRRQTEETGHGRRESRSYIQLKAPESLPGLESWQGLKSIGVAISKVVRDGKVADEVRYYISSLAVEPDARAFAHAVRSHWGVENPQPEDPRSDNLCVAGGADYHRRRCPVGVGRVERQEPSGPRRHLMLDNDSICVPPRPRLLRRTH